MTGVANASSLLKTPFHNQHLKQQAKMFPFAGYGMPVQYPQGIMAEHLWCRENAGLFDVSHMGRLIIEGDGVAEFLETVTPANIMELPMWKCRYTMLLNDEGGINDDIIITRIGHNRFFIVLNAGRKQADLAWLKAVAPSYLIFNVPEDTPILALQGPKAAQVMQDVFSLNLADLPSMHGKTVNLFGDDILMTRTGYTGEDGFELFPRHERAFQFWTMLMEHKAVQPVGLGARDSLRLEAGFPLYGHDLDEETSPIEAMLNWTLRRERLESANGSERLLKEREQGPTRKRVGIELIGKGIAREGCKIFAEDRETEIGGLTSGGFSPSLKKAIGQGYVQANFADNETEIWVEIRGKKVQASVHPLRFIEKKGA